MSDPSKTLIPLTPADLAQRSIPDVATLLAGQLAPASLAVYARDAAAYHRWAEAHALDALQPMALTRWRAELARASTLSPNTINRMLSAVKRVALEAARQGYLPPDVADGFARVQGVKVAALRERTQQTARTRITPEDMRRLVEAPDTTTLRGERDRALLLTLASSGLRVAELAALQVGDITMRGHGSFVQVRSGKGGEAREAALSQEAREAITSWLAARGSAGVASSAVFTSFTGRVAREREAERATGRAMSTVSVWRTVAAYATAIGLTHVKPHDFRRFVGTQLAKKDIRQAQKALGHKRIDTTARHYVLDELEPGLTDGLF